MTHRRVAGVWTMAGLLASGTWCAAQDLTPTQQQGRLLLNQNCAVCHLKPQFGAKTYGPELNRETLAGNAEAVRDFINMGTERMPGFRYRFSVAQVDSIADYLKTVPATTANAQR